MKYALVSIEVKDYIRDVKKIALYDNIDKARLKMHRLMDDYLNRDDEHNDCSYYPLSLHCKSDNECDELYIQIIETEKGD